MNITDIRKFSSVQLSSKLYLCARKSPYALRPYHCLWKSSSVCLIDDGSLKEDCPTLPLPISLSSKNTTVGRAEIKVPVSRNSFPSSLWYKVCRASLTDRKSKCHFNWSFIYVCHRDVGYLYFWEFSWTIWFCCRRPCYMHPWILKNICCVYFERSTPKQETLFLHRWYF